MFWPYLAIFRHLFIYWNCRTALHRKSVYFMLLHIVVHIKMCLFENKNSLHSALFSLCGVHVCAPLKCLFSLVGHINTYLPTTRRYSPGWALASSTTSLQEYRIISLEKSQDSVVRVVGIATLYGLNDQGIGVRVPVRSRICSSPCLPDRLWGPPNLLFNGYRGLFPRGQAAGGEANYSPPTSPVPHTSS
jgi:hypothetical protein